MVHNKIAKYNNYILLDRKLPHASKLVDPQFGVYKAQLERSIIKKDILVVSSMIDSEDSSRKWLKKLREECEFSRIKSCEYYSSQRCSFKVNDFIYSLSQKEYDFIETELAKENLKGDRSLTVELPGTNQSRIKGSGRVSSDSNSTKNNKKWILISMAGGIVALFIFAVFLYINQEGIKTEAEAGAGTGTGTKIKTDMTLKYALELFDKKEYKMAFDILEQLPPNGDLETIFQIAKCYYWAPGTYGDKKKAIALFKQAADKGHIRSHSSYAEYLLKQYNSTIPNDALVLAGDYYSRAAKEKDKNALKKFKELLGKYECSEALELMQIRPDDNQVISGSFYYFALTHGAKLDYDIELIKIAEALNLSQSWRMLAKYKRHFAKEPLIAASFYQKAASLGDKKSFDCIKDLAIQGTPEILKILAECYYYAFGTDKNIAKATENFLKTCVKNTPPTKELAELATKDSNIRLRMVDAFCKKNDFYQAEKWLSMGDFKALINNSLFSECAYALANNYWKNHNFDSAVKWYMICTDGRIKKLDALYKIGTYYLDTKQDLDKAERYFLEAQKRGLKDAGDKIKQCRYLKATKVFDNKNYKEAEELFGNLGSYKDSEDQVKKTKYERAKQFCNNNKYIEAEEIFNALGQSEYSNAEDLANECRYIIAEKAYGKKEYKDALSYWQKVTGPAEKAKYHIALCKMKGYGGITDLPTAIELFEKIPQYKDSKELLGECNYFFGMQYQRKEEYFNANIRFKKAADQGLLLACIELGLNYYNGKDGLKETTKAIPYLKKYANEFSSPELDKKKYAKANYILGKIYLSEKYKDLDEAVNFLEKSIKFGIDNKKIKQKLINAYILLGNKYLEEGDKSKALQYWGKSETMGASPKNLVGYFRIKGEMEYQQKRYNQALMHYEKASSLGDAKASRLLGHMYATGTGIEMNHGEAIKYLTIAAEKGDTKAMYALGIRYLNQDKKDWIGWRNKETAFKYFKNAAEKGNMKAKYQYALCYERGIGVKENVITAKNILSEIGTLKALDHMCEMGVKCYKAKQFDSAIKIFKEGANKKNISALYNLGLCYELALGVSENIAKAKLLYIEAANLGHEKSKKQLADLKKKQ